VPPGRATAAHASYQVMRELFVDLERIAGVEHRRGRSFYGLRRRATDLAPEVAQDARVSTASPATPTAPPASRVFQDRENERVRAHAATARRSKRRYLPEGMDGEEIAA
jgi:hypothetical protein